ncbi:acid-sensing ion channel 5-like [Anneissia japonica]|uniref:acid-sensing ion channel 5-like n=1 Tax=Anneissia japonica TaxID=1529436 RepID=UPI00142573A9|nr:acid-sensing ion channel 5-like [Anneissia japonica]
MSDSEDALDYDFATKTSMHGVQRLTEKRGCSYKLFWVIIIVVAVVSCGTAVVERIIIYFQYNVNTEIKIENPEEVTFPAVTICNFNRYRRSKISKTEEDYYGCATILGIEDLSGQFTQYIDKCGQLLNTTSFNVSEFTEKAGFDLDAETLWSCKFRGKTCDAKNFTSVITDYGRCWTFNGASGSSLKQFQPGRNSGLQLMINVAQYEYTETFELGGNLEAGLKFLVHPQDTPPLVSTRGSAIGTGQHAFADVYVYETDTLEEPWGQCKKDQKLNYYKTYSYVNCVMECRFKHFAEQCGCKPERYKGPARICDPRDTSCIVKVLDRINNNKLRCECYLDCKDISYETKLSYANIPSYSISNGTQEAYNESAEFLKDNVVMLDVYYPVITKQVYKQTKAMTFSALLSDIGGQLGLFVGVSIITVVEITEYLALKMGRCMDGKRGQRRNKKNKKSGVSPQNNARGVEIKEINSLYQGTGNSLFPG